MVRIEHLAQWRPLPALSARFSRPRSPRRKHDDLRVRSRQPGRAWPCPSSAPRTCSNHRGPGRFSSAPARGVAARYVNRLKLPLPVADLRDYLIAPPRVPEELPQTLRAYLTRVVIHDPSLENSAIVTQSFEPNPMDTEHAAILLDIDAFKEVALKPAEHDEIDRVLSDLHRFKNDIFFGNITQKASKLFE